MTYNNSSWVKQLKKKTLAQDSPDIGALLPPTAHVVYMVSLGTLDFQPDILRALCWGG